MIGLLMMLAQAASPPLPGFPPAPVTEHRQFDLLGRRMDASRRPASQRSSPTA